MKKFFPFLLAPILFFLLLAAYIAPTIKAVSSKPSYSKVIISVFDKFSSAPINNATICIVETDEYYYTPSSGSITITLPYYKEEKIAQTYKDKPWNEYTLLVYSSGYIPHIYFGLKIEENRTKAGVVINLEQLSPSNTSTYTTSYENPSGTYITELITKHKK